MPTDLPTRKRKSSAELFTTLLGVALMLPVNAFVVMLLAGADHTHLSTAIPAFSYGRSLLVTVTLMVVGSFFYRAGV